MKKKLPKLTTDKAAETFIVEADVTQYDLSALKPVGFEFQPKGRRISGKSLRINLARNPHP